MNIADLIRSPRHSAAHDRAAWTGQPLPLHVLTGGEAARAVRQRLTKKDRR